MRYIDLFDEEVEKGKYKYDCIHIVNFLKEHKFNINNNNCSLCALCTEKYIKLLKQEVPKKIKLTQFEYDFLNYAKSEHCEYIARGDNGIIRFYKDKPSKLKVCWFSQNALYSIITFKNLFSFVKFEDENPYKIDDILKNCEVIKNE